MFEENKTIALARTLMSLSKLLLISNKSQNVFVNSMWECFRSLDKCIESDDGNFDGGKGSGNWGHEGRPGEVGGSGEGGGKHNRQTDKNGNFTSFSKKQKSLAKPHKLNADEIDDQTVKCKGVKIVDSAGNVYTYDRGTDGWISPTDWVHSEDLANKLSSDENVRILVPNENSPNYKLTQETRDFRGLSEKVNVTEDAFEADRELRPDCEKVWGLASDSQKRDLVDYTEESGRYNSPLRKGEEINEGIKNITEVLDKSSLESDTKLIRGSNLDGLEAMLGLGKGSLNSGNISSVIGKTGIELGFSSTSASGESRDNGFGTRDVAFTILAPKGTKGMYMEPFSYFGHGAGYVGDGYYWDGKSGQKTISKEQEVLLQRGTSFYIYDAKYNPNSQQYEVAMAVTSQDYKSLDKKRKDGRGDGGKGSGNFNHKGRPGKIGGSGEGGGGGSVDGSPDVGKQFIDSLEDYNLEYIDHHSYLGNFGTKRFQIEFMKENGVSDDDINAMNKLFDLHSVNGGSDNEIVEHLESQDSLGKALNLQIEMEEALYNRYMKKHPEADDRVYRKGKRKNGIECWTTSEDGADMGYGGIGWDHVSTIKELKEQGYRILGGMGRVLGSPGESEVTMVKYKKGGN